MGVQANNSTLERMALFCTLKQFNEINYGNLIVFYFIIGVVCSPLAILNFWIFFRW